MVHCTLILKAETVKHAIKEHTGSLDRVLISEISTAEYIFFSIDQDLCCIIDQVKTELQDNQEICMQD